MYASCVESVLPSGPHTPMGETLIRFARAQKRFGQKVIYSNLSVEIRRGETITVMGPSGCGKSVMLKMLIGLIPCDGGSILYDGEDVTKMNDRGLATVR